MPEEREHRLPHHNHKNSVNHMARFSDGTIVPFDGKFHVDPLDPLKLVRCLEPWTPPGVTTILSGGNTAYLGLLSDNTVLKYLVDPHDPFSIQALDVEHCILSDIGVHDRITRYLGKQEHGLRFERAGKGDVRSYMSVVPLDSIPIQLRLKWATQAADALAFVHSRKVIHCDVHPNNLLLDDTLDLRLCDFSGSVYGTLDGAGMESVRFFLPRDVTATPSVKSDVFALGSAIYFIMTGREPYDTLTDAEVAARFSDGDFPAVDSVPCGRIILGCWEGGFHSADKVFWDLTENREALSSS